MAGRPSDYSPEIGEAICDAMLAKVSLRAICEQDGFPDRSTILRWLSKHEEFAAKYARAREVQADLLDDEIQVAADVADVEDWQLHRMRIETMKWRAGRMAPKKYGDKVLHAGADGGPIQVSVSRFTGDLGTGEPEKITGDVPSAIAWPSGGDRA